MNYSLEVDDKIWYRFKAECAKRGKSMKLILISLILEYIASDTKEQGSE